MTAFGQKRRRSPSEVLDCVSNGHKFLNEADKEAHIQIRTKWFTFNYIPLIPLASYRFQCSGDPAKWFQWNRQRRPLGRVPLDWNQALTTWLKTIACIVGAIAFTALCIWSQNWMHR